MANMWLLCFMISLTYVYYVGSEGSGSSHYLSDTQENATEVTPLNSDVSFVIYNRKNPEGLPIQPNSTDDELKSVFVTDISVKFITHGWLVSEQSPSVADLKDAYMRTADLNVVTVGWSPLSRNEYILATREVIVAGAVVGQMVSRFLDIGLTSPERIHLIGHSLGAHVMGVAGGFIRDHGYGKVARVTGLDPAKPFYEQITPTESRLDPEDGQFVDVIHSCIGVFGYIEALGHADFYPNGGYCLQPGCSRSPNIFCSHMRAFEYFEESIYNKDAYPAVKCSSYFSFQTNQCPSDEVVYMGNPTPPSARGSFYLTTTADFTHGNETNKI